MPELKWNPEKTALITVNLQKGVVENIKGKPYDNETVVANSVKLARRRTQFYRTTEEILKAL